MKNTPMQSPTSWAFLRRLQFLESSQWFQGLVIFIIVLSALMIGAKTYDIPPMAEQALWVLDWAVTVFFLIELCLRFAVCENKKRFFFDGWNVFDTLVVMGSLVPLENADAVLVGRLLRVFRVLRLVSVVPELRFLINSLLKAIPRMGYIALLMFIIFYIYAAIGSLMFQNINPVLWDDVSISMLTLFRIATFEDWTDVMYETMAVYPISWLYYLTFIFLTAFVFLNMMVGTILEVMSAEQNSKDVAQAHKEREDMADKIAVMKTQLDVIESLLKNKR
ncbi:ion transporter [Dasania marina]|uniref:ion transporter n=1 Tax=Dasania marina TaxID=471499 RepID=UPI0030DCCCCB|tara:strand:- start:41898 stop:42731 length:834 start_codon:yes stop_codon:yes gene_type:complete